MFCQFLLVIVSEDTKIFFRKSRKNRKIEQLEHQERTVNKLLASHENPVPVELCFIWSTLKCSPHSPTTMYIPADLETNPQLHIFTHRDAET
jgi:hypothetical protein